MFTGLIETIGTVRTIVPNGTGIRLTVDGAGLPQIPEAGASIAVNGACLTATALDGTDLAFDAVRETVRRTTLGSLKAGDRVNLESALRAGEPLDGHLVLGHVDAVATCIRVETLPESRIMEFTLPSALAPLVAEKGSVAVDGVSLTVVKVEEGRFSVSIIPETLERTTLANTKSGAKVNLEVDVIARYIARQLACGASSPNPLTEDRLRELGFA